MMQLHIGSDHAGFEFKEKIKLYLKKKKFAVADNGTFSEDSVDYPDYAHRVAKAVLKDPESLGILICGSGNGVCMTANKYRGIRAALAWNDEIGALAKQHNNANIICIPARFVTVQRAYKIISAYLNASFEGGRHQCRVDKIDG
jgi:ribose 5-phosphate isomerase B